MGSSYYAADVIAREARSRGLSVVAELASTEQLPEPGPELVVVAVSATGESVETLDACRRYAGNGRLVALTNRPDSTLAELSDVTIPMHAGEEESGVACRTFRHTVLMLRAILETFGMPQPRPLPELARRAASANASLLETQEEWLPMVADTLTAPLGVWVLGPVERLSSARQSALMVREVPRRIAYASETGDWSHVDVYLTKVQDYRALLLAGSRWDDPALQWMRQRGSTFVAVGTDRNGSEIPDAKLTIRYTDDHLSDVAQLSEVLVMELTASHWHDRP